jgi:hypothetical protein
LILILLNFSGDFRNFSSLAEVDELGVAEKIGISLLNVQDVGQVHAEEGHTRRIDRPQLLLILPVVILVVVAAFAECSFVSLWDGGVGEFEPVDGRRSARRNDGEDAIEVVELLEDHHDFDGAGEDGDAFLEVFRFDD